MSPIIDILHVEDNPADAELVQAKLEEAGLVCRINRVRTFTEFDAALHRNKPDIILSDFRLPMCDGISALRLARELHPEVPFIFVSGTMGEEAAIEGLTQGALDYVLKNNIVRLDSAVKRALQEAQNRREHNLRLKNLADSTQLTEELQRSNDLLRAIIEAAPIAIIGLDLDGNVHSVWNPAAEKILGWSAQEVMGRLLPTVPADRQEEFKGFREQIRRGLTLDGVEVRRQRRDGTLIDYSIYASPLHDSEGHITGNIAILVDITERKAAEKALKASEARYMDLYENAPDMYVSVNAQTGLIERCNQTLAKALGRPKEEIIGRPVFKIYHPDSLFLAKENFREFLEKGEIRDRELQLQKKDGSKLDVSLNASAIRSEDGTILFSRSILRDITIRKKLEEQLRQTQKMEAVGQLAGGVAHDFNNMLGVIIGYAGLALKAQSLEKSLHDALEKILAAAHRSSEVTRQLLAFARKQTIMPKIIDLNATVEGMLMLLRRLIGEDIDLAWRPGEDLWPVKMDPTQIDQILANLCINARDAIAGVGKVTIETKRAVFDEIYCAEHKGFSPGEYVMLAVSDTGKGMDKETMNKIFEPFFTTKGVGRGTGLGLATVYGVVKQNAGFINVYSELKHGSTFKIYIPRHAIKTEQMRKESPIAPAVHGDETILVVEDESAVLDIVKRMLEDLGYEVLASSSPGEAIRIAEENIGEINLLITDVVMPEMTGRELAKSLNSFYPELKCLFMSGYTNNVIAHHGVLDEGVNFIQKPFSEQELAAKVREVLDGT